MIEYFEQHPDFLFITLITGAIYAFLSFSYFYILVKKGVNKFLFVSASIGGMILITGLLFVFNLPFILMMETIIPQLAEYRQLNFILPIIKIISFFQENYALFYILLNVALPILIYRRYTFFHNATLSTTPTIILEGTTQ